MSILFYLYNRVRRRILSGIILVILFVVIFLFLSRYSDNLLLKHQQICEAYQNLPVDVVICNVRGTQTDNLSITDYYGDLFVSDQYYYEGVLQQIPFSSYVEQVHLKSTLYYAYEATNDNYALFEEKRKLVGISFVETALELSSTEGVQIHFFDQADVSFLSNSENTCILSEALLYSITPDDNGNYYIEIYAGASPYQTEANLCQFRVVGVYSGDSENIYIPWNVAASLLVQLDGYYTLDSIRARIKDNTQIPVFRELLFRHFLQVDPTLERNPNGRFGAMILDEELNQTVSSLKQNTEMLSKLYPIMILIDMAIAFVVCFIYVWVRRWEISILRFVGTTRTQLSVILLLEMGLWLLLALLIASITQKIRTPFAMPTGAIIGTILFAVAGTIISTMVIIFKIGIRSAKEAE